MSAWAPVSSMALPFRLNDLGKEPLRRVLVGNHPIARETSGQPEGRRENKKPPARPEVEVRTRLCGRRVRYGITTTRLTADVHSNNIGLQSGPTESKTQGRIERKAASQPTSVGSLRRQAFRLVQPAARLGLAKGFDAEGNAFESALKLVHALAKFGHFTGQCENGIRGRFIGTSGWGERPRSG